jgi:hypothetical protein
VVCARVVIETASKNNEIDSTMSRTRRRLADIRGFIEFPFESLGRSRASRPRDRLRITDKYWLSRPLSREIPAWGGGFLPDGMDNNRVFARAADRSGVVEKDRKGLLKPLAGEPICELRHRAQCGAKTL